MVLESKVWIFQITRCIYFCKFEICLSIQNLDLVTILVLEVPGRLYAFRHKLCHTILSL